MTIPENDPRLTAYALGELEADERAAFERELAGDPAASAEVDAIRALGARLEQADLGDAPVGLDPLRRERVLAAATREARPAWRRPTAWAAAAAALLVGALVVSVLSAPRTTVREQSLARVDRASGPEGKPQDGPVAHESRLAPSTVLDEDTRAASPTGLREPNDPAPPAAPPPPENPLFGAEGDEPVSENGRVVDHVETDNDLPPPEPAPDAASGRKVVAGEAQVVSGTIADGRSAPAPAAPAAVPTPPTPLSGPVSNGAIGTGGGAGQGFRRVGGDRSLRQREAGGYYHVSPDEIPPTPTYGTEGYGEIRDNPFYRVSEQDVSTFSIDVDTASYANVRRFLDQEGRLPPRDAVRIEELVNYFSYDYAPPPADAAHPFAARMATAICPWEPSHRLVRVALKGKTMQREERPAANLVFLLDVSGSMRPANKLPLVKSAMLLLLDQLEARDRVAIVVYAGAAGQVLGTTPGDHKAEIRAAIERLQSGGSTNGGAGIELAYRLARESFIEGGVNRVILCTDGDFNVGVSDTQALARLLERRAKSGVFLSILGFGMGNLKDDRMEELSNRGNGNYAYVDNLREAQKVLVDQGLSTLVTIAKDVKIQVFFNPRRVAGWRLIGYENRILRKEDFNDDTKDAGEIGAGHTVTALYEIVPVGTEIPTPRVDPNPFLQPEEPAQVQTEPAVPASDSNALLRLRLRYKAPDGDKSTLMEQDLFDSDASIRESDTDFQWATAVAGFGMMLRDSPYKGSCSWELIEEIAGAARGADPEGYRAECLQLIRLASTFTR